VHWLLGLAGGGRVGVVWGFVCGRLGGDVVWGGRESRGGTHGCVRVSLCGLWGVQYYRDSSGKEAAAVRMSTGF